MQPIFGGVIPPKLRLIPWHTVNDDMQHIDRNTLQAVGQTLIQVLFSERAE